MPMGFIDITSTLPNQKTAYLYKRVIPILIDDPDKFIELVKRDKDLAEKQLIERIIKRRSEIASATIHMYVGAVHSFLVYEEIEKFNWKKVNRTLPPRRAFGLDRAPRIEEIRQLLGVSDKRLKVVILIMCSSGMRIGGFDYLYIGNYSRLESGIGRLVIYRGEPEQYVSFVTPECCDAIENYLDERRRLGETIEDNSPMIRQSLNVLIPAAKKKIIHISGKSLKQDIRNRWFDAGLKRLGEGRGEVKSSHGFRKFFKTRTERTMKSINVEILMGHSIGPRKMN